MDLLSSIRKEGSRGGVDFKWSDVSTSQHRENYLGHSLMAPVGRWQKGRDLNWYAKADDAAATGDETAEEKMARERKEEIRRIKEAEEDALARALGLPVAERRLGGGTGANAVDLGEMKRVIKETEEGDDEIEEVGKGGRFGDFVGKLGAGEGRPLADDDNPAQGGLISGGAPSKKTDHTSRRGRDKGVRSRSRSGDRKERHRHREGHRHRAGDERHRHRDGDERHRERRARSRSVDERDRRHRSKSDERYRPRRDDRERRRSREPRSRTSRSPRPRDRDRREGYRESRR